MPLTFLIVDDDSAVTEMLSLLFKTQGFDTLTANSGEEGILLAREKKPDLIVLDMMMPEVDGWAVCKEVRSFSSVPIIVLSALNDPSVIASILDAGADDYLTKPAPSRLLLAHIKKLVRRSATGSLSVSTQPGFGLSPKTSPTVP